MDMDISTRARELVRVALAEGVSAEALRAHARATAEALMRTGERVLVREIAASMAAAELLAEVEGRQAAIARRA